jgi:RNA-directed DNA polymerase
MVETEAGSVTATEDWAHIPWRMLESYVYRLQKRIYKAQSRGDTKAVHSLQRLLLKSRAARTLAVRRVTQDNQGKKTAGVDGVKDVAAPIRQLFVERLRRPDTIKARPVRRVWIPKPGKDERRALGIPTMLDRAHQALHKLALEPQWEARFAPDSYGFRPGRSAHDAIEAIFKYLRLQDKYVLDADIKGCFDHIDHQVLLRKLETTPVTRRAVKAWLHAGILEHGTFTPSQAGTPQGGVISPLLANIALHGIEEVATQAYIRRPAKRWPITPKLVRYADDFVILCHDLDGITAAKTAVEQFLGALGLHLSPTKTNITHTLHHHEGRAGFDFLGFHIRQYPVGATHTGCDSGGTKLGFKTLITPSKQAITRHIDDLHRLIRHSIPATQTRLIDKISPLIWGWSRYYRSVVASKIFNACDHHLYTSLASWARRRHPNKSGSWRADRYWSMQAGRKWVFTVKSGEDAGLCLPAHTQTHIRRHVKVQGRASPYDGNLRYWATRLKNHPLTSTTMGHLLYRQHGTCAFCGLHFKPEDLLEIDHILPLSQGGKDWLTNKQALHRHCHDRKTALTKAVGCC